MSQTIEARAILSASDRTGGIFSQIAAKIRGMNSAAVAANRTTAMTGASAAAVVRNASSRANAANAAMLAGAGRVLGPAAVAVGAGKAYKNYADADLAVRRIGITADATEGEVAQLNDTMRKTVSESGKSFQEVTKGMASLTAGGMDAKEASKSIGAIAKTAQAAGAEVEHMATTTLALNQNLDISADKMQNAFDILVKGGKMGKFELKDMAQYFPSIAPAAVALGMKGEEGLMKITAALQTVRMGTGTTEEAAQSMQNIFAKMESEETVGKFKKMGVDLRKEMEQARKQGKNLLDVFVELSEKAVKGDLSKIPQLFSDMQFARGMRALIAFKEANQKYYEGLKTSAGTAAKDLEKVLATPAIAMERMKNSWDALMYSIGYGMDALSKKMGGKGGVSEGMQSAANAIEDIVKGGPGVIPQKLSDEMAQVARDKEAIELRASVETQRQLAEASRARGKQLAPWRVENLINSEARLNQLRNERDVPVFTEEEIQKLREMPLGALGEKVPSPRSDPRKSKGFAPLPSSDPRGGHAEPGAMPPVQDLNVEAKLTAEPIDVPVPIQIQFNAGSELISLAEEVKNALGKLTVKLNSNGAGSTGISSPDAVPISRGGIGSR